MAQHVAMTSTPTSVNVYQATLAADVNTLSIIVEAVHAAIMPLALTMAPLISMLLQYEIRISSYFRCMCRLGFEGTHCEHNVNECETLKRCSIKGTQTCDDMVNAFMCQCRPGYTGETCDVRTFTFKLISMINYRLKSTNATAIPA
jgi:hypothetical protein